jgi:hypothetical protein
MTGCLVPHTSNLYLLLPFFYPASMLIPVLAFTLCIASVAQNLDSNPEQSSDLHFSAEDESAKNAVPIPDGV